jgi:hypothetical protein
VILIYSNCGSDSCSDDLFGAEEIWNDFDEALSPHLPQEGHRFLQEHNLTWNML